MCAEACVYFHGCIVADLGMEMGSVCDAISLDISKEALGILRGEPAKTVKSRVGRED